MKELKLFIKYYIEKDLENNNAKLRNIIINFELEKEKTLDILIKNLKNKGIKIYEINSNDETIKYILEKYDIEYYCDLEEFILLIYKWLNNLEILELLEYEGIIEKYYNPNEIFYQEIKDFAEFYKEHFRIKYAKEKNKEILNDIEYLIDNLSEDIIKEKLEIDLGYLCLNNKNGEEIIIK